jgi:hypothetical protein
MPTESCWIRRPILVTSFPAETFEGCRCSGVVIGNFHGVATATSCPLVDHNSDDNADDSCPPNYTYNTAFRLLNSLFSPVARSWQCGGQGFESP